MTKYGDLTTNLSLQLPWLIFTQPLTMEYVRKFVPSKHMLELVYKLMQRIEIPNYIKETQLIELKVWHNKQNSYYHQALQIHADRESKKRANLKQKLFTPLNCPLVI